jgi:hypothetical protein
MKLLWDKYLTNERLHSHMNIGDGMHVQMWTGKGNEQPHDLAVWMCTECITPRERMVSRIAKYHQDLADIGEITGKWAKFIIKLYNVNEEGKATEWPTNDIPEWMKPIETKHELSPAISKTVVK